ncbi:unnamed protein product, partial [marine sediment metagenome]
INRKVKMINIIIIIILFCITVALFTFLLYIEKIGPNHFTILFAFTILSSLALYLSDRLKEIDLRNLRISLNELREVKRDIYAKAETVKKIGEKSAELIAYNVTKVGRFAPLDLEERILDTRDGIEKMLTEIGSDSVTIKMITSKIDETVLDDLKDDIYSKIEEITSYVKTRMDRDEIHNRVRELLKDYKRDSLVEFLNSLAIYIEEKLEPLLDRLDKFIKDKKL